MSFFLITQQHEEDGTFDQELFEAATWQEALSMAQLGWALENSHSYVDVKAELGADGYLVIIKELEAYTNYKNETRIRIKEVV